MSFGADAQSAREMVEGNDNSSFDVFPENWESVNLFLICSTQWRYRSINNRSMPSGLEYASVLALIRLHRLPREIFTQLQTMEFSALKIFASQ